MTQTNEELLEMLANATETYYSCGGHSKSDRNKYIAGTYEEELTKRGVSIPSIDELLAVGKFNGKGSV